MDNACNMALIDGRDEARFVPDANLTDVSATCFCFTLAEENNAGSDRILWGTNPDDNSSAFLREKQRNKHKKRKVQAD